MEIAPPPSQRAARVVSNSNISKPQWLGFDETARNVSSPHRSVGKKKRIPENQPGSSSKFHQNTEQKRFHWRWGDHHRRHRPAIINTAAEWRRPRSVDEMAQRGRLELLANILGKTANRSSVSLGRPNWTRPWAAETNTTWAMNGTGDPR